MVQTVYNEDLPIGFEGMAAESGSLRSVRSYISEEAAAFGYAKALVQGTADDQALLPTAGSTPLIGVSLHTHANEIIGDENLIQPNRALNVLHEGTMLVLPEEAVTPASTVFVRVTAGGSGLGSFRASDPGASAAIAATGMRYLTSGDAATVCVLEVDTDAAIS